LLGACAAQPISITGPERDSVLAYSEARTDNMMIGLNTGSYSAFARDFDAKMKEALTEAKFGDTQTQVVGKIGKYVARQIDRVEKTGDFIAVVYAARFEGDSPVAMRVVFNAAEPHLISGLWFDSAKLRK
jgi:O-glycosyl hydrolase